MNPRPFHVLILCTGNSARSILGEALINHWGRGEFLGFSAGSTPKGSPHPMALALLREMRLPTEGLRSKSWDEFAKPGAPRLDLVITVCDNAAGETCPVWPGAPVTTHWGLDDPAAVQGGEHEQWQAFRKTYAELERRIRALTSLPVWTLDGSQLKQQLDQIGRQGP
jgi:arsenate reductase (thioredoxin)